MGRRRDRGRVRRLMSSDESESPPPRRRCRRRGVLALTSTSSESSRSSSPTSICDAEGENAPSVGVIKPSNSLMQAGFNSVTCDDQTPITIDTTDSECGGCIVVNCEHLNPHLGTCSDHSSDCVVTSPRDPPPPNITTHPPNPPPHVTRCDENSDCVIISDPPSDTQCVDLCSSQSDCVIVPHSFSYDTGDVTPTSASSRGKRKRHPTTRVSRGKKAGGKKAVGVRKKCNIAGGTIKSCSVRVRDKKPKSSENLCLFSCIAIHYSRCSEFDGCNVNIAVMARSLYVLFIMKVDVDVATLRKVYECVRNTGSVRVSCKLIVYTYMRNFASNPPPLSFRRLCLTVKMILKECEGQPLDDIVRVERHFKLRFNLYTKGSHNVLYSYDKDDVNPNLPFTSTDEFVRLYAPSSQTRGDIVNLFIDDNLSHVDFITDLNKFGSQFICRFCDQNFYRFSYLKKHETKCGASQRHKFKGGAFNVRKTIFQRLEENEISVDEELKYLKFFINFDFESLLIALKRLCEGENCETQSHVPVSVAIGSNVSDEAKDGIFLYDKDPLSLIRRFIEVLLKLSDEIYAIVQPQYAHLFQALQEKIDQTRLDKNFKERNILQKLFNDLEHLTRRAVVLSFNGSKYDLPLFFSYFFHIYREMGNFKCEQADVYKKGTLRSDTFRDIISRGTQILNMRTDKLNFKDISLFLAPGCSYKKYLKNFSDGSDDLQKLNFPFKLMTHFDALHSRVLPKYSDFFSELKQKNSFDTVEDYEDFAREWGDPEDLNLIRDNCTLLDILESYNKADVGPMLVAVERHMELYKTEMKVDLFFEYISLPSVGFFWIFQGEENKFHTFPQEFGFLYRQFMSGRTGGLCTVLKRKVEVGTPMRKYFDDGAPPNPGNTTLGNQPPCNNGNGFDGAPQSSENTAMPCEAPHTTENVSDAAVSGEAPHTVENVSDETPQHTEKPLLCGGIELIDATSLYPAMIQLYDFPIGAPIFRRFPEFKPEKVGIGHGISVISHVWLKFCELKYGVEIISGHNTGEMGISSHNYRVDGFAKPCSNHPKGIAFQFDSCYRHGHICGHNDIDSRYKNLPERERVEKIGKLKVKAFFQRARTLRIKTNLQKEGYTVVSVKSCEWAEQVKSAEVKNTMSKAESHLYPDSCLKDCGATPEEIVENVLSGSFKGFVKCNIYLPPIFAQKYEYFPFFCQNRMISRGLLSREMQDSCELNDVLTSPAKQLVSTSDAKFIILNTELLRWYLQHNAVVEEIQWCLEYKMAPVFKEKISLMAKLRREGDLNPRKQASSSAAKLLLNSSIGKSAENKARHTSRKICSENEVFNHVSRNNFMNATPIIIPSEAGSASVTLPVRSCFRDLQDEIETISPDGGAVLSDFEHSDQMYIVEMKKRNLTFDLPILIQYSVYNYAKLHMLKFAIDVLQHYMEPNCCEISYSDTDSFLLEFHKPSLDLNVAEEKKEEFFRNKFRWFPKEYCDPHLEDYVKCKMDDEEWLMECEDCKKVFQHESKTPGLFKSEGKGDRAIILSPKMYIFQDTRTGFKKVSSKGISKTTNDLEWEHFHNQLYGDQVSTGGVNYGFKRHRRGGITTYKQRRNGVTSIYIKRRVMSDMVNTLPLNFNKKGNFDECQRAYVDDDDDTDDRSNLEATVIDCFYDKLIDDAVDLVVST